MWLFCFDNEPASERPHAHLARVRGPKGINIKVWLDTLEVAKAHPSFKAHEIRRAIKIVAGAYDLCMQEWLDCRAKQLGHA